MYVQKCEGISIYHLPLGKNSNSWHKFPSSKLFESLWLYGILKAVLNHPQNFFQMYDSPVLLSVSWFSWLLSRIHRSCFARFLNFKRNAVLLPQVRHSASVACNFFWNCLDVWCFMLPEYFIFFRGNGIFYHTKENTEQSVTWNIAMAI